MSCIDRRFYRSGVSSRRDGHTEVGRVVVAGYTGYPRQHPESWREGINAPILEIAPQSRLEGGLGGLLNRLDLTRDGCNRSVEAYWRNLAGGGL